MAEQLDVQAANAVRPARYQGPRKRAFVHLVTFALLSAACGKKTSSEARPVERPSSSSASSAASASAAGMRSVPSVAASASAEPARAAAPAASGAAPLLLDEPVEIAPIGPATAHELGVIMIDRQNSLVLIRRRPWPSTLARAKTPLGGIERKREDFVAFARGPAVVAELAYWVNEGRLVRRRIDGTGELEVLSSDARNGTRVVAAELAGFGAVVAYITKPDAQGAQHAKLWTPSKSYELTPEGAGTSSIAMAPQSDGLLAVSVDGRSAMTPLHARRIVAKGGAVSLEADTVVWVGASAQATTEVFAAAAADDVWAFVPIEQDVTHFGLAQIHVGRRPELDAQVAFRTYANGLNTAPVAAAPVCGRVSVAFAEPKSSEPGATQVLRLATLEGNALTAGEVVAEHRSFADASLAPVKGGGLLTYTANHRTWAVSVRCRQDAGG